MGLGVLEFRVEGLRVLGLGVLEFGVQGLRALGLGVFGASGSRFRGLRFRIGPRAHIDSHIFQVDSSEPGYEPLTLNPQYQCTSR